MNMTEKLRYGKGRRIPVMENGKEVTAETTFTAKSSSGTVDVEFKVDGSLLKVKSVVVFEDLYQDDLKMAVHADIEDEGQTVHFTQETPPGTPKTGDDSDMKVFIAIGLAALLLLTCLAAEQVRRHRKEVSAEAPEEEESEKDED